MKSKNITVPRTIIERHTLHPEPYGESIVILTNGMYTDVYTSEKGELYTITNDQELIDYLESIDSNEQQEIIQIQDFELKSINFEDFNMIHDWLLNSPYYRYDLLEDSEEQTLRYISHAKTLNSDVLKITAPHPVGVFGYQLINDALHINIDVFKQGSLKQEECTLLIKELFKRLKSKYKFEKVYFKAFETETLLNASLEKLSGVEKPLPLVSNTLTHNIVEYIYELGLMDL